MEFLRSDPVKSDNAVLTYLGPPEDVKSYCVVNARGLPNHFAQRDEPDISVQPADNGPAFRIVCEVSANREFRDNTFKEQLIGTLKHANGLNELKPVPLTYGLMVNTGRIGEDKKL